jgi:hypothetical protein
MPVSDEGWTVELAVVERDNRIGIVMKLPHPRYVGDETGNKIYAFAIVLAHQLLGITCTQSVESIRRKLLAGARANYGYPLKLIRMGGTCARGCKVANRDVWVCHDG